MMPSSWNEDYWPAPRPLTDEQKRSIEESRQRHYDYLRWEASERTSTVELMWADA